MHGSLTGPGSLVSIFAQFYVRKPAGSFGRYGIMSVIFANGMQRSFDGRAPQAWPGGTRPTLLGLAFLGPAFLGQLVAGCIPLTQDPPSRSASSSAPTSAPSSVPPPSLRAAAWEPGYWHWNGTRYVWTPGRWVAEPLGPSPGPSPSAPSSVAPVPGPSSWTSSSPLPGEPPPPLPRHGPP